MEFNKGDWALLPVLGSQVIEDQCEIASSIEEAKCRYIKVKVLSLQKDWDYASGYKYLVWVPIRDLRGPWVIREHHTTKYNISSYYVEKFGFLVCDNILKPFCHCRIEAGHRKK